MHFGTDGLSRMMCDPFTVCLRLSVMYANTIGQVMPDFLVLVLRTTIGSLPLLVSSEALDRLVCNLTSRITIVRVLDVPSLHFVSHN